MSDASVFEGDELGLRQYLAALPRDCYYTYLLLRPNGIPFYVGKGMGSRALQHEVKALRQSNVAKSNPFKCNTIRQIRTTGGSIGYRIDRVYSTEAQLECLRREEELIALYRRRCDGGCLTNLAAGLGSLSAPDPFSKARHAATLSGLPEDRPERAALNIFLSTLGAVESVPIKPLSEYRTRLVVAYPSPKALSNVSKRNCLTIAAAATAAGLALLPGAILPRAFTLFPDTETWPLRAAAPLEVAAVIENGAASDILRLGLVRLIPAKRPEDEGLALDEQGIARIISVMGRSWLTSRDLI